MKVLTLKEEIKLGRIQLAIANNNLIQAYKEALEGRDAFHKRICELYDEEIADLKEINRNNEKIINILKNHIGIS